MISFLLGVKDLQTISLTWTLPELGMDSIMSVELKQIVESEFDVFLSPQDLKTMTFAKLYKLKEEKAKSSKAGRPTQIPKSHSVQFEPYNTPNRREK